MLMDKLTTTEPAAFVFCSKNWRSSMHFSGSDISESPKILQGQQHQLLARVLARVWEVSKLEALKFAQDFVHRRFW